MMGIWLIDFFSFLHPIFHLIFRLNRFSHEDAIVDDQSQLKDDLSDPNVLDQESDYFLTDDDDEEQIDAADKSYVLDDSQMDSMIDENDEAEDEELFNL